MIITIFFLFADLHYHRYQSFKYLNSSQNRYLRLYGQTFSKEDHIYFINTLYEVIIIPGLELNRVAHYANVLSTLLK